ncbi:MAG: glycerophosphodiester phosphodiesterase [Acidobacteriota bacterium]
MFDSPISASDNNPLIIAHRGASAIAPENTLLAFARGLADGADGVELDVRLSRDGVPMVIHDSTLRRTGLCDGVVSEMTSAQLSQISSGDWFNRAHPALARADYNREVIPTLAQVFTFFKTERERNGPLIYVELKAAKSSRANVDLPASVVQLIKDFELQNRTIVVSFNVQALAQIKQIEPSILTGALFEPKSSGMKIISGRRLIAAAVDCGADEVLFHRLIATRRLVELAAEKDLRSVVWTVDDPKWISRATRLGIHALITNNPAVMIRGVSDAGA